MRWFFLVSMVLVAGCYDDDSCELDGVRHPDGTTWMQDCNYCWCDGDGVECTLLLCAQPDAATCPPTESCDDGPACGDVCCGTGEQCVDGVCLCGDGPACGAGDSCEAAGPLIADRCGSVCCGTSSPCPQ
jgi:hypothetical protein